MLSERISLLFNQLGCSNSDIARYAECNPSLISRIHTGNRKPSPSSVSILRLAEGIYQYADNNNYLGELKKIIKTEHSERSLVISGIINWLFDSNELPPIQMSRLNKPRKARAVNSSFGERLNEIMNLLELSNARFAKQLNVDGSQISRFRNGVRNLRSSNAFASSISSLLYKRICEADKLNQLANLMNIAPSLLGYGDDGLSLFHSWMFSPNDEPDTSAIDRMLEHIDMFSPDIRIQLPDFSQIATDDILTKSDSVYWGIDGLREAVIRFLGTVVLGEAKELWLYSDQDIEWMTGDAIFQQKWMALMVSCVKKGVKVKIIHNINRGSDEMVAAIQSWMPLYMSGMIEPYVCSRKNDVRFSHTLFLSPDSACIYASHIRGTERDGWYDYVTSPDKLNAFGSEFCSLLSVSESLINISIRTNYDFSPRTTAVRESGALYSLQPTHSLGTMPVDLLKQTFDRISVSDTLQTAILRQHAHNRDYLFETLQHHEVHEFIPTPSDEALFEGRIPLPFSYEFSEGKPSYTPEEYSEHCKAVLSLMNQYKNYHLYMLPETLFNDIRIFRQGKKAIVLKMVIPITSFIFSEPIMLHAFDDYFDMLRRKCKMERNEIRQSLQRLLL